MNKVLVFSNNISNYPELCAGAKMLGKDTIAFYIGSKADAETIAGYANKVYFIETEDGMMSEDFFETFRTTSIIEKPDLIMISATKTGKYMAARLAASMETSVLTDLSNLEVEGSAVKGTQMYYGGSAVKTVNSIGTAVVTVGAGVFEPLNSGSQGSVEEVAYIHGKGGIVRKEVRDKGGETVNLAAAKRVVGVGRGFANKEDIVLAEELAVSFDAEVGCTRPIAEGEGWMDTARYIGVSGVILKPDIYFAVGVSGQIQHTIGINSAKTIIAINKDKNAPVFKNCDYGIVGDLYKIVPALTELIKNS